MADAKKYASDAIWRDVTLDRIATALEVWRDGLASHAKPKSVVDVSLRELAQFVIGLNDSANVTFTRTKPTSYSKIVRMEGVKAYISQHEDDVLGTVNDVTFYADGAVMHLTDDSLGYIWLTNSLISFTAPYGTLDTSNVTDMGSMFADCTNLTALDLSSFDTSQVTDMGYMFADCSNLTALDLSSFDTSQVTYMNSMFYNCPALEHIYYETWTIRDDCAGDSAFYGCVKLPNFDEGTVSMRDGFAAGYMEWRE